MNMSQKYKSFDSSELIMKIHFAFNVADGTIDNITFCEMSN